MSVKEDFEKGFYDEEMELLVLMKEEVGGAMIIEDMLRPSVNFLASIDVKTGELSRLEGRIEWLIKDSKTRKGWGYDFKQFGIYHIRVRKCIPKELEEYESPTLNNTYMLIKIVKSDVNNPNLLELQKYYSAPLIIENELGKFKLDRQFSQFEGDVKLGRQKISVFLETDEDNENTANNAMDKFLELAKDFKKYDKKYREFAAKELTSLANDWLADGEDADIDEITEKMFVKRIVMSELTISNEKELTIYYDDDDMFWGHAVEVLVDENGEPTDADIVG